MGVHAMPIVRGKTTLYTALAGIKPHSLLPIALDVGTDNRDLLSDPMYTGVRRKRAKGKLYEEFIEEFVQAVSRRYGEHILIHVDDIGFSKSFNMLEQYAEGYCFFNDDIQSTAGVVLAGLIASKRLTKIPRISDHIYMFVGAGMAAIGIARLLIRAMMKEGASEADALCRIIMFDKNGLLTNNNEKLSIEQAQFAKGVRPTGDLMDVLRTYKPTVLIGSCMKPGIFNNDVLRAMGTFAKNPIIFALSSPNEKAECTAEQAYKATEGRCIFSSGSPCPPYKVTTSLSLQPGQANTMYISPAVALAALTCHACHIKNEMFLIAAETLAGFVTWDQLKSHNLYPPLENMKRYSLAMAMQMMNYCYNVGVATRLPQPALPINEKYFDRYNYNYSQTAYPKNYPWPKSDEDIKVAPLPRHRKK